ncbi:MAG: putative baseplate assembly protein [Chloroflexi bacterium]|nr:putative baseplate assembly protein [Chloroflexota bacterium]
MSIKAPNLDDLRFQRDLVDEARKRIIHYCPEWTEYNLSDPGITLIELFAWMTEQLTYRLNRVPEKNYIKFLDMLGMQGLPANSASTELTFWLSVPLPITPENEQRVVIPQAFEVRSELTDEDVLFTTDTELEVVPPILEHLRKEGEFNKNFLPRLGLETFYPFDREKPQEGDTFYLGFDVKNNIAGHILQLYFETKPTEAVGIRREDPPWIWEYLNVDGKWEELKLSTLEDEKDTTGGLNNESGNLVLYLPISMRPTNLYGLDSFWIRCRIEQRESLQGMYDESPRVSKIEPFSLGGTVFGTHSVTVENETLGTSKGEPGQSFALTNSPILTLRPDESVEVETMHNGNLVFLPWARVDDFSKSTQFDRHYILNMATGEIEFGPSVRQPDGTVSQYGRVPESGRLIRFSKYRYGGGVEGNLPEGSLRTMLMSLAYIARVSNLTRAVGGRDQETIEELKLRAQRELQAQRRAVTAQDYEEFTKKSSRAVARTRCLPPDSSQGSIAGAVSVLVVPEVPEALKANKLASLHLNEKLRTEITDYVDQYRLLTTSLLVREPHYAGVKVQAKIVPQDFINPAEVILRVNDELQRYLTPLPLDEEPPSMRQSEKWQGWEFGKDLFIAEVVSLIQQISSVKYVLDVKVLTRPILPVEEGSLFDDEPKELSLVEKVLRIPDDGLLCSLEHEIEIVDTESMYDDEGEK